MAEPPVVLLSPHVDDAQRDRIAAAFPQVRFPVIGEEGRLPPGGDAATAVLRVALRKPDLSAVLRAAPGVRWVHTSTAGFDWALVPEIVERGIVLTRSAASYAVPIGEFTLALIASLVKRLPDLADAQRSRRWATVVPAELAGLTVAVVGTGGIGQEVAWRCRALGMRLLGVRRDPAPVAHFDEVRGPDALHEVIGRADVVVIACPLTPETRGLFDAAAFRAMRPGAYLINVARGPIVVAADLVEALRGGTIAGAAMDAFDVEPLPDDDPLWKAPNLVVTPHTSFQSPRNLERVVGEFLDNLGRFLDGRPLLHALRDHRLGY